MRPGEALAEPSADAATRSKRTAHLSRYAAWRIVQTAAAKAGVPVFSVNPGVPDRGSFFDVGFDFHQVGLAAGRLAADLLEGVDPRTIPIRETTAVIPPRLFVNLLAPGVDRTRWRIPDELLATAAVVVDGTGIHEHPDRQIGRAHV